MSGRNTNTGRKVCLHLIDSLGNGGAENLLCNTVNELTDFDNIVLCLKKPYDLKSKFSGAEVICLNATHKWQYVDVILKIRHLIRSRNVSIVHSHSYWTHILSRLATGVHVKLFNTYHFADYDTMRSRPIVKAMILLDRLLYKRKITIIAVSEYIKKILQNTYSYKSNIICLPNFISDEFFNGVQAPVWNGSEILKMIAIGNIKKEKNYDLLIKACQQLNNSIKIDIYGSGSSLNEYQQKIKMLGLNNISFKGTSDQVHRLLKHYHVFIMTSFSEACPLSPLQAMAAGMPMILSDIPSLREIAEGKAIFFKNNDVEDLVVQIRRVLDGKLILSHNAKMYEGLLEKYKKEQHMKMLNKLYKNLCVE